MNPVYVGYFWCALASVASAAATFLIKLSSQHGAGLNLMRLVYLGGACGAYGLGFICYAAALSRMQITLAYPVMTAITMMMVAAMGCFLLQESLTPAKIIGMLLVTTGAFVLAR